MSRPITVGMAIGARLLFHKEEGMMWSCGPGVKGLALLIVEEEPLMDTLAWRKGRWWFHVEDVSYLEDITCIPEDSLKRDSAEIHRLLVGLSLFDDINPLSRYEFTYLQRCIGVGNWCKVVPIQEK